ncbi:hypothetical protein [Paracoccus lutimaris]|uniref:ASCH domain-containing protein n=1 Tax=Paracoccus lutimaris TaxID=1490030 RepID=A0A368Z0W9_9RHOB|nr:hypothetical protein [Paracoccus lutimaris]RCW84867.1 hypothetical protein DFP89_107172 [Paracoccus lutimaris]
MVAYNFQTRFADAVASGQKCQTIRAQRKDGRHAQPGDRLQLYTGMRTKACRKLIDPDPVCAGIEPVVIDANGIHLSDGRSVPNPDMLARWDGFASFAEMAEWFDKTHGLPFTGMLIQWDRLPKDGWIERYVAHTLACCGFTHFDDGGSVADYARECAAAAFDDPYYRSDGPEACAEGDMEYWGED